MLDVAQNSRPIKQPVRRWFQFSLRALLLFVTLACGALGWLGIEVQKAERQKAAVIELENLGGRVAYDFQFDSTGRMFPFYSKPMRMPPAPAWLSWLGDDFFRSVRQAVLWGVDDQLVVDDDLAQLAGLNSLRSLSLDNVSVYDVGLEAKYRYFNPSGIPNPGLQEVILRPFPQSPFPTHADSTIAALEQLKRVKGLEILYLNGSQITDAGLEHIKGLPQLRRLNVVGTRITAAGVRISNKLGRIAKSRSSHWAIKRARSRYGCEPEFAPSEVVSRLAAGISFGCERAIAVAILAAIFSWVGWQYRIVSQRQRLRRTAVAVVPGSTTDDSRLPAARWWLGDSSCLLIAWTTACRTEAP